MPQRKSKSLRSSKQTGNAGEDYASRLLKKKGYKVITRNFQTRHAEIDIVATDEKTLVFVEVKTRRSEKFGNPVEAVNEKKLWRIKMAADEYISRNKIKNKKYRIDVVSILLDGSKVKSAKIYKVV